MQLVNRFKILTDKVRKIAPRARLLEQADEIATQVIKLEPKYEKLSDVELKNILVNCLVVNNKEFLLLEL